MFTRRVRLFYNLRRLAPGMALTEGFVLARALVCAGKTRLRGGAFSASRSVSTVSPGVKPWGTGGGMISSMITEDSKNGRAAQKQKYQSTAQCPLCRLHECSVIVFCLVRPITCRHGPAQIPKPISTACRATRRRAEKHRLDG